MWAMSTDSRWMKRGIWWPVMPPGRARLIGMSTPEVVLLLFPLLPWPLFNAVGGGLRADGGDAGCGGDPDGVYDRRRRDDRAREQELPASPAHATAFRATAG